MNRRRLDDVDRRILEHFSQDARMSNREVAQALGLAEGTVRSRIKRLQESKTIKIIALTNFAGLNMQDNPVMAYIGVRVDLHRIAAVAQAMAALASVRFVATMLGRYDILVITIVKDGADLVRMVNDEIMGLPGVRHAETTLAVKSLKYDYRWGRIIDN